MSSIKSLTARRDESGQIIVTGTRYDGSVHDYLWSERSRQAYSLGAKSRISPGGTLHTRITAVVDRMVEQENRRAREARRREPDKETYGGTSYREEGLQP